MPQHDVTAFTQGLGAKLATRSRHVCVFLGAGASKACGLPDVAALEDKLKDDLDGHQREAFVQQLANRNLEQALSRLRRIAAIAEGDNKIDGLDRKGAEALDREVCRHIASQLEVTPDLDLKPAVQFAAWAGRSEYLHPLEIFTVNYDLVVETVLEKLGIPYFDGFVGALHARFRADLVEAGPNDEDAWLPRFMVRLWKLHGSVNWTWDDSITKEVVRVGHAVSAKAPAAIYPSDAKYDESRRVPFVVLQDRLRRALRHPETLVLVSGYSWTDEHLNETFFDAATHRPRSEVVALCYSDIPDSLAERAAVTPNLQVAAPQEAIVGGQRGAWSPPDVGDHVPPSDVWCDGDFQLGDFTQLAQFLARSSSQPDEFRRRLKDLLQPLGGEEDD